MAVPDPSMLASHLPVVGALLDRVPDPMVLIQEDGTVAYVNAAGGQWFHGAPISPRPLAVGDAYLERLRELCPAGSEDLAAIEQGLRAVLRNELDSLQRSCRWQSGPHTGFLSIRISACQLAERPAALLEQRDITAERTRELELRDELERLALFKSLTTDAMVLSENGVVLDCNEAICKLVGYTQQELIGMRVSAMVTPEHRERVREHILNNRTEPYEHMALRKDGTCFEAAITGAQLHYQGRVIRGTVARDLTTIKAAERALGKAQEEKLQAQAALLAELSTPLIPINDQTLVMPLIGSVDSQRAQQVLATLLSGIEQSRARIVIIDITGVRLVDSHVAGTLVLAAKATRLLGAQVVLTGIRAEVAQTLVRLGVDLDNLTTKATLQSGIAYAIAQNRGTGVGSGIT